MPRTFHLSFLTVAALYFGCFAHNAGAEEPARIAKFKGDCDAAISFTLDDGWEDAATLAAPLLDKYGIHATFVICPGRVPEEDDPKAADEYGRIGWKTWKKIAAAGHEIGSHTLHHPGLTKADDATLQKEVDGAYDMLLERIGAAPISFAYPYNARDERVRKVVYAKHTVAREFETGYGGPTFTAQKANAILENAIRKKEWLVPMVHAIEKGYAAFTSAAVFEEHLQYVQSKKDQVWIDTFGNIGRYVKERDDAKLDAKKNGNSVTFTLKSTLDAKKFDVPLTVVIDAPNAASAEAKRDGEAAPIPVTLTAESLLIDVQPGSAPVTVSWKPK